MICLSNSPVAEVSTTRLGDTLSKVAMVHLALKTPAVPKCHHGTGCYYRSSIEAELEMCVIHNTDSI